MAPIIECMLPTSMKSRKPARVERSAREFTRVRFASRCSHRYLKIAAGGAAIGATMELFMIHTGFYEMVTELESEKRAWESSPEAQALREALNPWRNHDEQEKR
ncbi:hypothetical protein GUJ93_ZPchr0009g1667 [Zizania palustris]|uniref:Uncharacterized protein n=1 Tax=Zizania palustris TaxID=103762 RepID=A0A8J5RNN7_ZIZPA|nr:hypothetical protein GUJ93_ZPchr0009g1667 [Zizania palustris]